jgi:putative PIN family toxin of toxin-antitoxin system
VIDAVLDTSVFVAAAGWHGASHRVLVAVARRKVRLVMTHEIVQEYESTSWRVAREYGFSDRVEPLLRWIERTAWWVDPSSIGKPRSRDATDDKFLAAALASGARHILSYDDDLLALEKPFGISIQTPEIFLRMLSQIE